MYILPVILQYNLSPHFSHSRFPDEIFSGSLFRSYSQSNCFFDRITSELTRTFKCIPWDVMAKGKDEMDICPESTAATYRSNLTAKLGLQGDGATGQECLSDCHSVIFKTSTDAKLADPAGVCSIQRFDLLIDSLKWLSPWVGRYLNQPNHDSSGIHRGQSGI